MSEQVVLMYHDVVSEVYPRSGFQRVGAIQYTLTAEQFEAHVRENCQETGHGLPLVFTFDDGGSSFYTLIADILERYGLRGMFFISSDYLGQENFLTVEQVRELDRRGHIIGSHSHTHPRNISLLSQSECLREWTESRRILETIVAHPVTAASVPGGATSGLVIDCMVEAGYDAIYTSEPTTMTHSLGSAIIYGRYGVTQHMTAAYIRELATSEAKRRQLHRKYQYLRFAKFLLGNQYNNVKQMLLRIQRSLKS